MSIPDNCREGLKKLPTTLGLFQPLPEDFHGLGKFCIYFFRSADNVMSIR
jgi:hypothetical protein